MRPSILFNFDINFTDGQVCAKKKETLCSHGRIKYDFFTEFLITQGLMVLEEDNPGVNFTLCPKKPLMYALSSSIDTWNFKSKQ